MNEHDRAHAQEHELARLLGFYSPRFWWIDSFSIDRKVPYYKYFVLGHNGMSGDERIAWHVPQIAERPYVFALRVVVGS